MRAARRPTTRRHQSVPPAQSRLILPHAVAALRRTREALCDVEGQLGDLLAAFKGLSQLQIDAAVPDRLEGATARAGLALAALEGLRQK